MYAASMNIVIRTTVCMYNIYVRTGAKAECSIITIRVYIDIRMKEAVAAESAVRAKIIGIISFRILTATAARYYNIALFYFTYERIVVFLRSLYYARPSRVLFSSYLVFRVPTLQHIYYTTTRKVAPN